MDSKNKTFLTQAVSKTVLLNIEMIPTIPQEQRCLYKTTKRTKHSCLNKQIVPK